MDTVDRTTYEPASIDFVCGALHGFRGQDHSANRTNYLIS